MDSRRAFNCSVLGNGEVSRLEGQMTNVLARQPDGSWKIQLQSWN